MVGFQLEDSRKMSGAWSQLEQLLTCAICLDRFRNPKLLPCQHTFCGEPCMEGLVDYARRQIKCPECRAEHRIPYNGVQSFPNNVTLTRFLDLHRGITGEEPEPLPSQMDRCGVCGEKSFCVRCSHCEKKVCEECKTAHLDILRREISRINTQVRRGLVKLTEHTDQADKCSDRVVQISAQIKDEITESVRRLVKDIKDKEAKLLAELEEFELSETKNGEKLKEDLDSELQTIQSNCELVEEHVTEDDEWTDAELMEYKDIFLKTLDFLRNLDPDTMDFSRKIKYIQKVDLDNLRRTLTDFGEIKISQASASLINPLSPSESANNLLVPQSNLMRSQSDHRLAAQFASRSQRTDPLQRSYLDVTAQNRYGSDSDRERGSSPPGRRGERYGSVHERNRYGRTENSDFSYTRGWQRPGDSEYEPSNSSNFRSRFMRERIRERGGGDDHSFEEGHESEVSSIRSVRFQEEMPQQRAKLFDTEEMVNLRAPLSGIIKLMDSPHVMERLYQNEIKAKLKENEEKENHTNTVSSVPSIPVSTPAPRPMRQVSEDEIEKQKKQNKAAAAAASDTTATPATPTQTPTQPQTPKSPSAALRTNAFSERSTVSPSAPITNRRVQALQKEETRVSGRSSSDDNSDSGDITCDDDTTPASALNTTTRRRMFASTHSSSNGNSPSNMANSLSQGVDYVEPSSRAKAQQQPPTPLTTTAAATATANRQVSTSSLVVPTPKSTTGFVPGEDLMSGSVQPYSVSPSKLLSSKTPPSSSTSTPSSTVATSSSSTRHNINNPSSSTSSLNSEPLRSSSTYSSKSSTNTSTPKSKYNFTSGGGGSVSDTINGVDYFADQLNHLTSTSDNPYSRYSSDVVKQPSSHSYGFSSSTSSPSSTARGYSPSSSTASGSTTISAYPSYSTGGGTSNNWRDYATQAGHSSSLNDVSSSAASVTPNQSTKKLFSIYLKN